MDTEIESLRGEVLRLQAQQEDQRKRWLLLSRIGSGVVLVLAVASLYCDFFLPLATMKISAGFSLALVPLGAFLLAFGNAVRPTSKSAILRYAAVWVIICVLLGVLFTLFQFKFQIY